MQSIVSIGAVYFDPSTGNTGAGILPVASLESSMIVWHETGCVQQFSGGLKQSSEARSAILDLMRP